MGGGSFALPLLRTEPALRAAPVFRSAYFPKKLFSFFSKTLDLQPLCGLRWAGEASLSPLLRTEPALRAAPVFRSAYFPKKLFSFFSKTLDLQPLCGLRWAGEASLSPCSAPKCPFRTFRCFAWLIQLRQRTALSPLKHSCFRFATLTLRCRTPLSCPCRTDLSSVQKTPHLFSDGQTGGNSARTILFPLPG